MVLKLKFVLTCMAAMTLVVSGCGSKSTPKAPGTCGNGTVEGAEECDGDDLNESSCLVLGHDDGILNCNIDCTFDETACIDFAAQVCKNGLVEGTEDCDLANLNGHDCTTLGRGFTGGTLECGANCQFNTGRCDNTTQTPICSNNTREGNEACDGSDLAFQTCTTLGLGFTGGFLSCQLDCSDFDVSACTGGTQTCPNGIKEGTETCDGADVGGQTCIGIGFTGGTLMCNTNCDGFNTIGCTGTPPVCGDGNVTFGEDCDGGNLDGATCQSRGFIFGTLSCSSCSFDTSGCFGGGPVCGNNTLEAGEDCDGTELGGESCASLGAGNGPLACTDCNFNYTGCDTAPSCGDGSINGTETCDGDTVTCVSLGLPGGATATCLTGADACTGYDTSNCQGDCCAITPGVAGCTNAAAQTCVCNQDSFCCDTEWDSICAQAATTSPCTLTCTPFCGNNTIELGEECDDTNLLGFSCTPFFDGGTLACLSDCSDFDTSGCTFTTCGNVANVVDGNELCDGADLNGFACTDSPDFSGGTLACDTQCLFDTSGCIPFGCGNDAVEPGEVCDGIDLDANMCTTLGLGFTDGNLGCQADCQDFDTTQCTGAVPCGNGMVDPGEDCDGVIDPAQADCTTLGLGFTGGTLTCNSCTFVTTACTGPVCGNNVIDAGAGEVCDGSLLNSQTCMSLGLGFTAGTLDCAADCGSFDTSLCTGADLCGNGQVDGSEACDTTDFGGSSCVTEGFSLGSLSCSGTTCTLVTTDCSGLLPATCGDGALNGVEVCDGNDFGGTPLRCSDVGLGATGDVFCNANCTFDFSVCTDTDVCQSLGLYNNDVCDTCELFGGTADPDCAALCGVADGRCPEYYYGGVYGCQFAGTPDPDCGTCGDGVAGGGEFCDGTDDRGLSCADFDGYASGSLGTCRADCTPDFAACVAPVCNGVATELGEVCDGGNVGGLDCLDFGFTGGDLACDSDCSGFDRSACTGGRTSNCCSFSPLPGCDSPAVETCVCAQDAFCCNELWDQQCIAEVTSFGCSTCAAPVCGNNFIELGEVCEPGQLFGFDCTDAGFTSGTLACDMTSCTFDDTGCFNVAETCQGDDITGFDICDGTDVPTCAELGLTANTGEATCDAACQLDLSACTPTDFCAANFLYNNGECDPCEQVGGTVDPDCLTLCGIANGICPDYFSTVGGFGCELAGLSDPDCGTCGDGLAEQHEPCDPGAAPGAEDFRGATCATYPGFDMGTLICNADCTLDFSGCALESCGNNAAGFSEPCDGTDVRGFVCQDGGFDGGNLACAAGCADFDTSGCTFTTCGNVANVVDGNEFCDGTDLQGFGCSDFAAFVSGTLACASNCEFDVSNCTAVPATCGDGNIDALEACDTANLNSQTCTTLGLAFTGGDLTCQSNCAFDTSGCFTGVGSCGDGVANGTDICDGTSWASGLVNTCADWGLDASTGLGGNTPLSCTSNCVPDFSVCTPTDFCAGASWYNDGFCDACELLGGTADTADCAICGTSGDGCISYIGFGVDSCTNAGTPDPDCGTCNDGTLDVNEFCDTTVGTATCADVGYTTGSITCTSSCEIDFTGCTAAFCGNAIIEGAENCEGSDLQLQACTDIGYTGGTLGCDADCNLGVAGCTTGTGQGDCCTVTAAPGCDPLPVSRCVCEFDSFCCTTAWDATCTHWVGLLDCDESEFSGTTCPAPATCNNGALDAGEFCDGAIVPLCTALGFTGGGPMVCAANCLDADLSSCF